MPRTGQTAVIIGCGKGLFAIASTPLAQLDIFAGWQS
jgi:hypothetical protein